MVTHNKQFLDKNYIKRILIVAKVLGILPFCDSNGGTVAKSICYKLYSILLLLTATILSLVIFLRMPRLFIFDRSPTLPVMNLLYYATEFIIFSSAILRMNIFGYRRIQRLYDIWRSVDEKLAEFQPASVTDENIVIKMGISYILWLTGAIYDIGYSVPRVYMFMVLEYVHRFYIQTISIVLYGFLYHIKIRLSKINFCLISVSSSGRKKTNDIKGRIFQQELIYLKYIILTYSELCDMLDEINNIFGWTIFFITINIQLIILTSINYILIGDTISFYGNFTFSMANWMCMGMFPGVILASCSEGIIQETKDISVNAMKTYNTKSLDSPEDERSEDLYLKNCCVLLQNVVNRKAVLTAARFFEITYAAFFVLSFSFTSYLMVLLQFN